MDYEKKYKDLVEKLKKAASNPDWEDERFCCVINEHFPKLKESEDERIRNWLMDTIKQVPNDSIEWETIDKSSVLAWLEKQAESDETKAKKFLINKGYPIDTNGIFPTYEEMYNIIREGLEKQGEQKSKDKYTFNAIPRLLEMIEPTNRAKSYCQKLIVSLLQEGYTTDAKIVSGYLKRMNGEKVAMATMDEQKDFTPKVGDWIIRSAEGFKHTANKVNPSYRIIR